MKSVPYRGTKFVQRSRKAAARKDSDTIDISQTAEVLMAMDHKPASEASQAGDQCVTSWDYVFVLQKGPRVQHRMVMHERTPKRACESALEGALHLVYTIDAECSALCAHRISLIDNRINSYDFRFSNPQNAVSVREKTLNSCTICKRKPWPKILDGMENGILRIKAIRVDVVIADNRNHHRCPELLTNF
jgi:hypothetical protein